MSEFIRNQYGKVFKITKYNLDGRPDTERNMYICLNCQNFYICKESVMVHNCDNSKDKFNQKKICYDKAIKYLQLLF